MQLFSQLGLQFSSYYTESLYRTHIYKMFTANIFQLFTLKADGNSSLVLVFLRLVN